MAALLRAGPATRAPVLAPPRPGRPGAERAMLLLGCGAGALLQAGCGVNAPADTSGQSPAHLAARGGQASLLLWQLRTGADSNQQVAAAAARLCRPPPPRCPLLGSGSASLSSPLLPCSQLPPRAAVAGEKPGVAPRLSLSSGHGLEAGRAGRAQSPALLPAGLTLEPSEDEP